MVALKNLISMWGIVFYHLAKRQKGNFTSAACLVSFMLHGVYLIVNANSKHGPFI